MNTIVLRGVLDRDLPIFFEHQNDPEAARMAAFRPRERDAFLAHWRENVLGNADARAMTIEADGAVAGYVASWRSDEMRLVAYWLGREFWGRGIATTALTEFLALERTRPLHAYVAAHNAGSIRVLERCGFRRIGEPDPGADGVAEHHYRLE